MLPLTFLAFEFWVNPLTFVADTSASSLGKSIPVVVSFNCQIDTT